MATRLAWRDGPYSIAAVPAQLRWSGCGISYPTANVSKIVVADVRRIHVKIYEGVHSLLRPLPGVDADHADTHRIDRRTASAMFAAARLWLVRSGSAGRCG